MLQVVARTPHKYSDRPRAVGERYFIEDKMLPTMEFLGWVEPYDPAVHGTKIQPHTVNIKKISTAATTISKPRKARK